jgi:hypothetical protein
MQLPVKIPLFFKSFVAAVLGIIVASMVSATLFAAIGYWRGGASATELAPFIPLYFLFSLLASVIFGFPLFLVLNHFCFVRWWSAMVGGFVVGFLVAVCITLPSLPQAFNILSFGIIGAASAIGFWLVWKIVNRLS